MLDSRAIAAAMAVLRRSYMALSELQELTGELSQAVSRQDQVAVRMFMGMRQEQISQLTEDRAVLKRQCGQLPPDQGEQLRALLSARACPVPEGVALFRQAEKNRALRERVIQADAVISRRMGGEKSFYTAKRSGAKG